MIKYDVKYSDETFDVEKCRKSAESGYYGYSKMVVYKIAIRYIAIFS